MWIHLNLEKKYWKKNFIFFVMFQINDDDYSYFQKCEKNNNIGEIKTITFQFDISIFTSFSSTHQY